MSKPNTSPSKKEQPTSPNDDKQERDISSLFVDVNVSMKSGHLTRDAEIVGGGKYVKMRFAGNKEYEVNGAVKSHTNYFEALVSSNLSETFDLAASLKKGDWIYLKGEDSTRSFDTPEGYKKTANTIFAYHVALKKEKGAPASEPAVSEAVPA